MILEENDDYLWCRCDKCGNGYANFVEVDTPATKVFYTLFRGRNMPQLLGRHAPVTTHIGDICCKCSEKIIPLIHALSDIWCLVSSVNQLERTIREKRKQNQNHR